MNIDYLYQETETPCVRYVSFLTERKRYDIGLLNSQFFCGKSIVFCLQSGKMLLLSSTDIPYSTYWIDKLGVDHNDIPILIDFLELNLTTENSMETI